MEILRKCHERCAILLRKTPIWSNTIEVVSCALQLVEEHSIIGNADSLQTTYRYNKYMCRHKKHQTQTGNNTGQNAVCTAQSTKEQVAIYLFDTNQVEYHGIRQPEL